MKKTIWTATIGETATLVTMIAPPLSDGVQNVLRSFIEQGHTGKYVVWVKRVDEIRTESGYSARSTSQYMSRICKAGLGSWDYEMEEGFVWFRLSKAGHAVVESMMEAGAA